MEMKGMMRKHWMEKRSGDVLWKQFQAEFILRENKTRTIRKIGNLQKTGAFLIYPISKMLVLHKKIQSVGYINTEGGPDLRLYILFKRQNLVEQEKKEPRI